MYGVAGGGSHVAGRPLYRPRSVEALDTYYYDPAGKH
jgi:hypothetical protein